jgi:hypothetical protein
MLEEPSQRKSFPLNNDGVFREGKSPMGKTNVLAVAVFSLLAPLAAYAAEYHVAAGVQEASDAFSRGAGQALANHRQGRRDGPGRR